MTLDEAIKRQKELKGVREIRRGFTDDVLQAIQLGIEALEREWVRRRKIANVKEGLLPSETE